MYGSQTSEIYQLQRQRVERVGQQLGTIEKLPLSLLQIDKIAKNTAGSRVPA